MNINQCMCYPRDEDDKDPPDKNKSRQVKCDDEDDEMSPGSPPSYPTTSENAALKYNDLNGACHLIAIL